MSPRLTNPLFIVGLALAGFLVSCVGTGQPQPAHVEEPVYDLAEGRVIYMGEVPTASRTVLRKDYALGVRRTAAVGETLLSVENYTVTDRVNAAVALEPFRQPCRPPRSTGGSAVRSKPAHRRSSPSDADVGLLEPVGETRGAAVCQAGRLSYVRGLDDDRYSVAGALREGGNLYYLIEFDAGSDGPVYLATDARGRVKVGNYLAAPAAYGDEDQGVTPLGVPLRPIIAYAPLQRERPLFRYEVDESIDALAPDFRHFALMYEGTTYDHRGMVYHLLYREYRREDRGVPLFEQSLAFAGETSTIDLLGFRIRVHDVDDRQIVYTVQRD